MIFALSFTCIMYDAKKITPLAMVAAMLKEAGNIKIVDRGLITIAAVPDIALIWLMASSLLSSSSSSGSSFRFVPSSVSSSRRAILIIEAVIGAFLAWLSFDRGSATAVVCPSCAVGVPGHVFARETVGRTSPVIILYHVNTGDIPASLLIFKASVQDRMSNNPMRCCCVHLQHHRCGRGCHCLMLDSDAWI